MLLDEECKGCLYNSQLKKVEKEQGAGERFERFKRGVKALCQNPPAEYCAPLLMRDIDRVHREIFGGGIDYSKEKHLFNSLLLNMERELFAQTKASADPLCEAVKLAMAANYIDFARLADLDGGAVDIVLEAATRANPKKDVLQSLKNKLAKAKALLYLHDNCGEIVLDKVLIRIIKSLYPQISVTSVVRGAPIINDVTLADAEEVGLFEYANVIANGSDAPGTYLKEISEEALELLASGDVIIAKGLGNLETLYGEGYDIFYLFTCKCGHISARFGAAPWSAVITEENI
ncbi:MAG: ARMT1-like domain-containing protein [Clostridia bacterium]|nr:ARMT1-like domain-containing protein [Clostridia bacterium]